MSDRRLAAVMVTDIVGFTALMYADQQHALDLVDRAHTILKSIVLSHDGEWLEDTGDRSFVAFPSAINAVRCAVQIQDEFRKEPDLKLRIGIDVGDILLSSGHAYGNTVNIASFIERLADPEGLVITESVYDSVRGKMDLTVIDLGEKILKNVSHSVRLFALTGVKKGSRLSNMASALVARRLPHITGAYLAAGWAITEVVDWLGSHGIIDSRWTFGILVGLVVLVPSVLLVTYTHGAHGRDRSTKAEKILIPLNLLIAALAILFVYQRADIPDGLGPIDTASVAVLPFVSLSDETGTDYFSRGLSEEVINTLAKIPGLYVASRTSSFLFDSHAQDPRDIARQLRVANILEGSVRRQDNRVRVTAQLIDGSNNYHVWTEIYDRELADIFQIQEDIAQRVARELIGVLQPQAVSTFAVARAATVEGYDYYLQGLDYLRQPATAQSLMAARDLFLRTLAEDGAYAPAYAGLCQVSLAQYVLENAPTLIDQAESDCLKALRLDDRAREVRSALGVLYRHTGDFEESRKIFQDLLKDQRTPSALIGLAQTEVARGNLDAAEHAFQTAIEMEPGNWHNEMALAEFLYWRGRFADAETALQRVIALSPDNARAYLLLGASRDYLGDDDASLRATLKSIELSPTRGAYRDLGLTYYYLGDFEKALDAFKRAVELGPADHWSWDNLANTYRLLGGHEDESRAAYDKAAAYAAAMLQRNEKDWVTLARLAMYNVMRGAVDDGLAKIRIAVTEGAFLNQVHYYDAVILAHLGEDALALDALQRAIDRGYPVRLIAMDPQFIELGNDARFGSMIEEQ